jgi:NACalpha-BTF3-like transcription factor
MTAAEEAKQLDSVTDVVHEKELDADVAKKAMSALTSAKNKEKKDAASKIAVSREDVDLIVSEMEISEEEATRVLREVASEGSVKDGQSLVEAALTKLVVS